MEKKRDGNFTGMLREVLNKFWKQHPTKQQCSPGTVETQPLYPLRHGLSEDSGFKSYPSRPEVYLVKNMVR